MNILEILGCIGGTLYLVNRLIVNIKAIIGVIHKFAEYKAAYDEKQNADEKEQIGFKQEEKNNVKYCPEKIKLDLAKDELDYFYRYWESEPVDDEFIEDDEEEYEDELDKYPLLKVRGE